MESPSGGPPPARLAEPFTRILGHNWEFDRASLLAGRFAWFKGFGSMEHYSAVRLKTPPLVLAQSSYSSETTTTTDTSESSPKAEEAETTPTATPASAKGTVTSQHQSVVSPSIGGQIMMVIAELCPHCRAFYEENGFLNPNESCLVCVKRVEELNRKHRGSGQSQCQTCKGKCSCYQCAYCSEVFPTTFLLQKHTFVHCQDSAVEGIAALPPAHHQQQQQQQPSAASHQHQAASTIPTPSINTVVVTAPQSNVQHDEGMSCTICPLSFATTQELENHLRSHKETYCSECKRSYKYLDSSRHVCRARHTCPLCGVGFSSNYNLKMHVLKHSGSLPYKCSECSKSFSKPSELNRHGSVHSGERPYPCPECGMTFSNSTNLRNHKNTHTGLRPYPCGVCGKSFTRPADVKRHLLTHTGVRPHACDICGLAFADSSNLKKHVTTHTRGSGGGGLSSEQHNPHHQQHNPHHQHHDIKTYQCTFCSKLFSRPSELKRHFFTHTNTRPFSCDFCGLAFADSSNLKKHVTTHSRQPEHMCYHCDKTFNSFSELESHVATHKVTTEGNGTGGESGVGDGRGMPRDGHHQQHNICVVCGAVFVHFSELQEHSMSHVVPVAGVTSTTYRCEVCSKTFCQDIFLQRHLLTHTESRPYGCPECLKCFKSASHLKNHSLTHGGEKSHVCHICQKSFLKKSSLRRHEVVHTRHHPRHHSHNVVVNHTVGAVHNLDPAAAAAALLQQHHQHQQQKYHQQHQQSQQHGEEDNKHHHSAMFQVYE